MCALCRITQCRGIDPVAKTVTIQVHREPVRGADVTTPPETEAEATVKRLHNLHYDFLVFAVGSRRCVFVRMYCVCECIVCASVDVSVCMCSSGVVKPVSINCNVSDTSLYLCNFCCVAAVDVTNCCYRVNIASHGTLWAA